MSIDLGACVLESRTLAEILRRAEEYVAAVPHPPFVVLTPSTAGTEARIEPFVVPELVRDGHTYKDAWTVWDRGELEIGAGPMWRVDVEMAYSARIDDIGLPMESVKKLLRFPDESGYRAILIVHRTRGSLCLAILVATAIADLNRARIWDGSSLLSRGEWVEPAEVIALFQRHREMTSFEALIDAVIDELGVAPNWERAQHAG